MSDLDQVGGDQLADSATPAIETASVRSVVDGIRAKHEHNQKPLSLCPPRWDGDVVIRYGRVAPKAVRAIQNGHGNSDTKNARLLGLACKSIEVRGPDGAFMPLDDAPGAPPVRFDARLADLFHLPKDDQAKMVLAFYADSLTVDFHVAELIKWIRGEKLSAEVAELEESLGEETAAT